MRCWQGLTHTSDLSVDTDTPFLLCLPWVQEVVLSGLWVCMVPMEEKHLVFNEDKWLIYYYLAWDNKTFHRQWGEIASISMSNGDRPFTLFNTETALMECVWDTVNTTKTTSVDICMSWMRQLCECCVHCTVIHLISGNACRDQAEFKRNWKTWKSATQWG